MLGPIKKIVFLLVVIASLSSAVAAESVTRSQERAAAEYLAAVAAGDPQAMAFAIHPAELDRLRIMVVQRLREEASRGESGIRSRLFGDAVPLSEIERMTSVNVFRTMARRFSFRGRVYDRMEGLTAVRDGNVVHVMLKARQPKDRGRTEVVELVSLVPYGQEWKAAVPRELEAQLEDLIAGRQRPPPVGATSTTEGSSPSDSQPDRTARTQTGRNTAEILSLLEQAEKALVAGRCDRYYREHLSPELRRTLSGRTLDALIAGCNRSIASRELLIAALRIVRRTPPVFESGGNRAIYDVAGQGLPYDRYVLERVDGRWFIAE